MQFAGGKKKEKKKNKRRKKQCLCKLHVRYTVTMPPNDVALCRAALADCVINNNDTSEALLKLINIDRPLEDKFEVLDFTQLLVNNVKAPDNLKRLSGGFNILEKYGRHLLKPAENRSNMWRHIKFNNSIFRERVDTIQGGRQIMQDMGYTVMKQDGVAFPDNAEPDHSRVLNLVMDILLAKKEIEVYLTKNHPHPHTLEAWLQYTTRSDLVSGGNDPRAQETSLHVPSSLGTRASPVLDGQGRVGVVPSLTRQFSPGKETVTNESISSNDQKTPSITCDICGDNHADFICKMCDNKQLCKGCHIKWHKHPKRQNHLLQHLRPGGPSPTVTPASSIHLQQLQGQQNENKNSSHPQAELPQYQQQPLFQPLKDEQQRQQEELVQQRLLHQHSQEEMMRRQQQLLQHQGLGHGDPGLPQEGGDYVQMRQKYDQQQVLRMMQQMNIQGMRMPPARYGESHMSMFPVNVPQMTPGPGYSLPTSVQQHLHRLPQHSGHYLTNMGREGEMVGQMSSPPGPYVVTSPAVLTAPSWTGHSNTPVRRSELGDSPEFQNYIPTSRQSVAGGYQSQVPGQYDPGYLQQVSSPGAIMTSSQQGVEVYPSRVEYMSGRAMASESKESDLLKKIKSIPDLEKRQARLEVHLSILKDDITAWEEELNLIMLKNLNFLEDPSYKDLCRRKRNHLQQIQHLETYKKDLEQAMADHSDSDAKEREAELENLRNRYNVLKTKEEQPSNFPSNVAYPPPFVPFYPETPKSKVAWEEDEPTSARKSPQVSNDRGSNPQEPPPLQLNSLKVGDLEEALQEKYLPSEAAAASREPAISMNIPVTVPGIDEVSNPPGYGAGSEASESAPRQSAASTGAVPKQRNMKHGSSVPNIKAKAEEMKIKKHNSASDFQQWECQHCTYRNPTSERVCQMCSKTSDNPKFFGQTHKLAVKKEQGGFSCMFCTFVNQQDARVCSMCGKTLGGAESPSTRVVNQQYTGGGDNDFGVCDKPVPAEESVVNKSQYLDQVIAEDQDKVYLEKKAAQEAYDRVNREISKFGRPDLSQGDEVSFKQVETVVYPNEVEPVGQTVASVKQKTLKPKDDRSSQGPVKTEEKEVSGTRPPAGMKSGDGPSRSVEHKGARPDLNFADAIEQINLRRAQEQMSIDGHEFLSLIKAAEKAGYDVEEVEVAMQQAVTKGMKPLDWLQKDWQDMLTQVTTRAAEYGKRAAQNDVGDLTQEEAKEALLLSDRNLEMAVDMCVKQRSEKYKEIMEQGDFAREEVLTALFQNQGDVEEALAQLTQSCMQGYVDRLWADGGTRGNEVTMAAATAVAAGAAGFDEANNSVINSAVGEEDFQTIVKDVTVDIERRVRMILVEGKLQSWGRAVTVIAILDKEVTESQEPLECSLEDIIEAVRNCQDRKSSLVYLKQECQVCYSLFPMSKILNLSSCNCRLCQGCVRQNFEVVIREQYVRNWGCPLCQSPNLEDSQAAENYFELLSLQLQQLVSQEIMDLFDTKLRDWHLQKDPNFRWCAHCACGFMWDRADNPAMTCPHCHRKTCFNCKKKWEEQHEGLTCEEFTQWKIDNDPDRQAKGIQLYLEENGIDCPSCKMRYCLAKGGCMHFKCPQCGHEFCSGCSQAFLKQGVCKLLKSCKNKGLHCHHPRDCFYYLRDMDVQDLQKLLKNKKVMYNTEISASQEDKQHCSVMEQKEEGSMKRDEACGGDTKKGMAGLCQKHYKEYLVGIINKHKIDPIYVMTVREMTVLIERNEKEAPKLANMETEAQYRRRLQQYVIDTFQLQR